MLRNPKFQDLFDKFNQIQFDNDTHTYTLNGNVLTSVTKWVSSFDKPFDTYSVATKMSKNTGKPVNYYTQYWKMIGEEAIVTGNRVHHFAAWYVSGDKCRDEREEAVAQFINDFTEAGWELVATEFIVYDDTYAGCIDRIMYHPELDKYMLVDFKTTDKDLNESKGKLSNGTPNTLYNKYSMQLNKYNELSGLDAELMIVQITTDYRTYKV